ncbi:M61 family metallopeptidase [Alcaligenes sp. SDU_A2]|uniref:M61 family metallopeptidase n=1 Tax=Alcaligenes sp. SDU_A2 TaxID=3136634 RepID=UPI00311EFBB9
MEPTPVLYRAVPQDLAGHRLTVQIQITHPHTDGQILSLPAWIPGSYLIRDFSRQIEDISASSHDQPVSVRKLDNHRWQCAPCQGPLLVQYQVYAWDLSVRGAHIDETHAFFNGAGTLLAVEGQTGQPCLLELPETEQIAHWSVYTSLPEASGLPGAAQRYGFGLYRARDYDDLIDHPIEMGTPQVISFFAHGAEHELVFTGVLPNLDLARIARDVEQICATQIAFFEPETRRAPFLDSSSRYVFMTMVTDDGYGGLEHRASTALMASRRDLPTQGQDKSIKSAGYQTFLGLVSHEYFHTWNVKRIKPAAFAPYDLSRENHTRLLWVFEGFTSYYDDLMLLRSGVVTESEYLSLLAKNISAVQRSPGRFKQSAAQSSFDAWTRYYKQDENSPNALVSYYTKGALIALGLDLCIRAHSNQEKSLDDVMLLMWERYGRDFYQGTPQGIAEDAMPALILEATGYDATDFIARYVEGRDDLPLKTWLPSQGIQLGWKAASTLPSLGARLRQNGSQCQLATVFTDGAAHHAGLSAGDTLVALDGLRISDSASLERLLGAYEAGQTVQIHVFRRDELRCFTLQLTRPALDECVLSRLPS